MTTGIAASLLLGLAAFPVVAAIEAPSFALPNANYRVYVNDVAKPVVQNECEGSKCRLRGANNIASVTMQEVEGVYVPVTVVVEKLSYDASVDGLGWNIRPSHLQEEGVVTGVNSSSLATSGSISFTVTAPCQLSVELGSEDVLFTSKNTYWAFPNLIIAVNPPESSWPKAKPTLTVDSVNGAMTCISAGQQWGRSCVVAHADDSCDVLDVPYKTDIYFSSSVNRSFLWADGCGMTPKRIRLAKNARLFLDEDVVIFARVVASSTGTGIYGYGVISNFYMHGQKDSSVASNIVALKKKSVVFGVILMDSTYRNIQVGEGSTVEWTKSFAWEGETDGVSLLGIDCAIRNNFFKVNDDVLKAFRPHTVFEDNVIWHQTTGRALMLSWGNWNENQEDRDGSTQILRTSIIHDYRAFKNVKWDDSHPEVLSRQTSLVLWGSLISVQHSMDNDIGRSGSPVLIRDFHVEGLVGVLMSMSTGYKQLDGAAFWQASNGCGGNLDIRLENLDLRRVRSYAGDSVAGGCDQDYQYAGITNAECLCTTDLGCGGTRCHVNVDLVNVLDSEVFGVPRFADTFHAGSNTHVEGLATPLMI